MKKILVLHGVNLNMFGKRDPKHYGTFTLPDFGNIRRACCSEYQRLTEEIIYGIRIE